MGEDWLEDETMSREDTLARFAALEPEPAVGPHIPAGGYLVRSVYSFAEGVTVDPWHTSVGSPVGAVPQPLSA